MEVHLKIHIQHCRPFTATYIQLHMYRSCPPQVLKSNALVSFFTIVSHYFQTLNSELKMRKNWRNCDKKALCHHQIIPWLVVRKLGQQHSPSECRSPCSFHTLFINSWGPIFRRFHCMPWPPNWSLNVSGSCLTIFSCLYYFNLDVSISWTGV